MRISYKDITLLSLCHHISKNKFFLRDSCVYYNPVFFFFFYFTRQIQIFHEDKSIDLKTHNNYRSEVVSCICQSKRSLEQIKGVGEKETLLKYSKNSDQKILRNFQILCHFVLFEGLNENLKPVPLVFFSFKNQY